MRRLACTLAARISDKYKIRLTRSTCREPGELLFPSKVGTVNTVMSQIRFISQIRCTAVTEYIPIGRVSTQ